HCWTAMPPTRRPRYPNGLTRASTDRTASAHCVLAMSTAPATVLSTASVMRNYLHAKDENRPVYMTRAFARDAVLKMTLRTQAIAFPPEAHGLDAITETLVRTFGHTYENVFTFYLAHPGEAATLDAYACDWFVGMTERSSGQVRVGCGRYDWEFQT